MRKLKVQTPCIYDFKKLILCTSVVDENLFYKGVDKKKVHGARLQQTQHPLADSPEPKPPTPGKTAQGTSDAEYKDHPPYPFVSGNSLLALTNKHNVRIHFRPVIWPLTSNKLELDDHRPNRTRQRGLILIYQAVHCVDIKH